ncbi:hypothetical protein MVEG_01440 [Podila verticillata NRRL 6337]|nr:hypothetical protein MVEG_01440 [Podila verticillata NRRL 6337]
MSVNNSYANSHHEVPEKSPDMVVSDTTPSSPVRNSNEIGRSKTMPSDFTQYQFTMHGQGVNVLDMDSIFQCINVRWININGMSWSVIKAIAIEYDLHHLVAEDLLHVPQRPRSCPSTAHTASIQTISPGTSHSKNVQHKQYRATSYTPQNTLKELMEQVAIFLLADGTLITLFQVSGQSVVAPIIERLSHNYCITRKYEDAIFLLQFVLDAIVDHAIPITAVLPYEINDMELHVLAMPRMKYTRDLHRLIAQISMLKRTLAPTQMLVHPFRGKTEKSPLSSLAMTYMRNVMDNCNTGVEDIGSMMGLCEKLINMIFNLIAYDTNESMRRLALVSIIFLQITLLLEVLPFYGTSSEEFPELKHSIEYFWTVCGVVTLVFVVAIVWEWGHALWKAQIVERKLRRRDPIGIGGRSHHSHDTFSFIRRRTSCVS